MKKLTYSSMARARLRANRKQYISLILGIFLSIFMVSSLVLGIYGMDLAQQRRRYERVGSLDVLVLDGENANVSEKLGEQELQALDLFDQMGRCIVSGLVEDTGIFLGRYDQMGEELINLKPTAGRLPEAPGEIAIEPSVLDTLEMECQLGDEISFDIVPVNGIPESRSFTLVGFLPERSDLYHSTGLEELNKLPSMVISAQEPSFATGRLGIHYLLTLKQGVAPLTAMNQMKQTAPWFYRMNGYCYVSRSGEAMAAFETGYRLRSVDLREPVLLVGLLGTSLILSCGVGIFTAMESLLSTRQGEIGILRALGATRRQIRRMFGRENWLLALTVSPVALALSCLMLWGLGKAAPLGFVFGFRLRLLVPIALFSMAVILVSGYFPLHKASKQMPMSVIRDTGMLRRSKKLKYKKAFQPARLMSSRQMRFNPGRQIGGAVLVCLMLVAAGVFSVYLSNVMQYDLTGSSSFIVFDDYSVNLIYAKDPVTLNDRPAIGDSSVAKLRSLSGVKSITVERCMPISLVMEKLPQYIITNFYDFFGVMDDDTYQAGLELTGDSRAALDPAREQERKAYLELMAQYDIPGYAYNTNLVVIPQDDTLQDFLISGTIDWDAVNEGRQVIMTAGQIWAYEQQFNGETYTNYTSQKKDDNSKLVASNDSFTPGQSLHLLQMYRQEPDGEITRNEKNVTLGAIVEYSIGSFVGYDSFGSYGTYVLTTEQGFRKLGLDALGGTRMNIYLNDEPTQQEEEILERQIGAIARRTEGTTVRNILASLRQQRESSQQVMLAMLSMAILFFFVSVSVIVSSAIRNLNSQGRTIGMLRAVGADEKTLLKAYGGQIHGSMIVGTVLCFGVFLVMLLASCQDIFGYVGFNQASLLRELRSFGKCILGACAMSLICGLTCHALLRQRIRQIVNKSIIENIREL